MVRRFALVVAIMEIVFCLCGCMGYRHSRTVDGPKKSESTTLLSLFKKGEASVVGSTVQDGDYSRTVGAQSVKGSVDAKGISSAGGAIGEAGKAFVKP